MPFALVIYNLANRACDWLIGRRGIVGIGVATLHEPLSYRHAVFGCFQRDGIWPMHRAHLFRPALVVVTVRNLLPVHSGRLLTAPEISAEG